MTAASLRAQAATWRDIAQSWYVVREPHRAVLADYKAEQLEKQAYCIEFEKANEHASHWKWIHEGGGMSGTFFHSFRRDLVVGVHDTGRDEFRMLLATRRPKPNAVTRKDIGEVRSGHGYSRGGAPVKIRVTLLDDYNVQVDLARDVKWNGSLRARYAVLNNATRKKLVCWWDLGGPVEVYNGILKLTAPRPRE